MKRLKKIASVLLAMVMALAMTVTAFAAQPGEGGEPPEPTTPEIEHTYEIYQIFTGDYSEGVLSNIKWGENGAGTKGEKVDNKILEALEGLASETSDTTKLATINQYANLGTTPIKTGHETSYNDLTPGYYLVKDQDGSLVEAQDEAYTLYVVQVVDNTLSFTPKSDIPTSEKKIVEDGTKVDNNEASIGDTVSYEITGTLPSRIDDYKTYYYVFTDTLSKGLTAPSVNEITVRVDGVDVTKYFYRNVTSSDNGTTTIKVGIQDLLALNLLNNGIKITKDSEVVITYTATLNQDAVIAGAGNPNDVKLEYSNNPNNSGDGSTTPPENPKEPSPTHPSGETPEDRVVTYTTELTIQKNDEDGKSLAGVEFTLTGDGVKVILVSTDVFEEAEDGEYWKLKDGTYTTTAPTITGDSTDNSEDYDNVNTKYKKETVVTPTGSNQTQEDVKGIVGEDGRITFTGLGAGEYTITETSTPDGYNTIEPITFNVSFDEDTLTFESDNENIVVGGDNMLDTTIVNFRGSILPSTGGIGTKIFYTVGGILVVGAVILLVTRKRMSKAE